MNAPSYSRIYELQPGVAIRFTLNDSTLEVDWLPTMPSAALGRQMLPLYRSARNDFLGSLGILMLVVEI